MIRLRYHTRTTICLSLEDYHNAGLTPEETKAEIEKIINPFQYFMYSSGDTLRCSPQGINSNWNVSVSVTDPDEIEHIVGLIEMNLSMALSAKQDQVNVWSMRR